MSSLANAIKRKTHKERSQPAARKKYGLLEKHKDYVERARDFHRKERTIKTLQRKAEERNPDEFYFAMQNAKTKAGVHVVHTGKQRSQEELLLLKSQDIKYLTLKERVEAEKIRRMQESLHFIGLAPKNKHTVFVDSKEEAKDFDPAKYFDCPEELLDRAYNRPRSQQLKADGLVQGGAEVLKSMRKAERRKYAAYKELGQRAEREKKLAKVAAHLIYEKELAGKGRKRKLKPSEIAGQGVGDLGDGSDQAQQQQKVFRWKRERKR